ncbi:hypothetical protein EJB05_49958 [Eragrostis curvula]|uniref:Pirin N-terminal domain-containing protein n=1 Tax=Eragrostis curvula TaxID=38414 RepID=A0A5J9T5R7_9POAL|nr:hypothetical protein EJB05_49958 [Eragrostis curvula]
MSAAAACVPMLAPPAALSSSSSSSHHHHHHRPAEAELNKASGTRVVQDEATVEAESVERAGVDDDVISSRPRAVVQTLTCERKQIADGFALWRSIGRPELPDLDPFLSFDEFEFSPPAGFPDHPHRGFESVTYMLEGGLSYHDFSGHKGTINKGDVQWMTAGRGVVHAEMPGGEGVQRGISIWVNLSAKDKITSHQKKKTFPFSQRAINTVACLLLIRCAVPCNTSRVEPKYQEMASDVIPVAEKDDGVSVKVIAGDCLGTSSPLRPRTPAMCLDVTLQPGAALRQPVPRGWSACAYVLAGEAVFAGSTAAAAAARTLVVFGGDGDCVEVRGGAGEGARVLLVAARPHGEAVARDGPFVMNTAEEVEQAREDYRRRRNGFEMADGWTSDHATALTSNSRNQKIRNE